ncbi:MAG: kynureninase, partial [Gammaproteobacteria bacterium]
MKFDPGIECARTLDDADTLAPFRRYFQLPKNSHGQPTSYLCGHSLGPMPRSVRKLMNREMDRWAHRAAEGHFDGNNAWYDYHERFSPPLARLVGAQPSETVAMNSLTVNLHLMLVSFFQPNPKRYKVMVEAGTFPSDRYAVMSHLLYHGLDPKDTLIEFAPEPGSLTLKMDEYERILETEGERIALVLLPGVHYLSGQLLDVQRITALAHKYGCRIGFDLAHSIGNVPLNLHRWGPDFAVWCSYKYLNGGPGAVGGCFIHDRWAQDESLPRLAGWWGHDKQRRMLMEPEFCQLRGAEGWQLSNPPIFSLAPLEASLAIFEQARLPRLRKKSEILTSYLRYLLETKLARHIKILTPSRKAEH